MRCGVWSEETEVLVEEGSQAVLPCHINLQSPAVAQVRWGKNNAGTVWRKDRSGLEYYGIAWTQRGIHHRVRCPHTGFSMGNYSLYMTNVTEKDGGLYSCRAEGNGRLVHKWVTLRVIKVSTAPSAPVEGTEMVLSCNMTPWHKTATTHWRLNGELIGPQENQINDIEGASTHKVAVPQRVLRRRASQSLAGNWTCVVRTEHSRGEATQHLSVRGIVHPTGDHTRVYAAVGSAVTLPCVFSHGAIPSNLVWEKTSGGLNPTSFQLPPSSSSSSSQSPWDGSASLGAIVPYHQGTYQCSGMMEGRRLTRRLQLVISHVESNRGDPEILTCQLSDDSEVTQYEWVHITQDTNGTPIVTSKQQGKVLRIHGVTETLGEWACRFYGKKGMLGNATYPTEKIIPQRVFPLET
ncbi:unnamed protein product [Lota lota]